MLERKIAIVEDQIQFREYVSKILESGCIYVTGYSSAEEYLQDGINQYFDLIFLDINLNEMSGLDLLKYVNKQGLDQNFVILTSVASDSMIVDALENGAIGYILKQELSNFLETTNLYLNGGSEITPTIAFHLQRRFNSAKDHNFKLLSDLEMNILKHTTSGYPIEEVAINLNLSVIDIQMKIRVIYSKFAHL